jgi:hypothetical protein
MRLVKTRTETLTDEQTGELFELVLASKRSDSKFFRRMERWKNFVKGEQWGEKKRDRRRRENRVTINLAYAFLRALIPTLYFRDPVINALPTHPAHEGKQEVWELVTNNSLPRIDFSKETQRELFDAALFGEGWSKLVFNKGADEDEEEGIDSGAGTMAEGRSAGPTPWQTLELPLWLRQPSYNVTVDRLAEGRDLQSARFIAIEYLRPLSELRADPRYSIPAEFDEGRLVRAGLARGSLASSAGEEDRVGVQDFIGAPERSESSSDDLVRFWEVWVYQLVDYKLYKQVVVLADGAKKPIRGPVPWEELVGRSVKGWPFERLVLNYVPDDYPLSEIEVWAEIAQMFNWAVSMIVNQLRTQTDIITVDNAGVKNAEKAKQSILAGDSQVVVEVTTPGAVDRLGRTPVSRDAFDVASLLERFGEKVSGISGQRQGEARNIRTATESSLVERGTQIVTDFKVEQVRAYLKSKIEKWQACLRDTMPDAEDFVMRIAGNTGGIDWKTFSLQDLDWAPEINVQVDSFRQADFQEKMQKWGLAMNMMLQMFPLLSNPNADTAFAQFVKEIGLEAGGALVGNEVDDAVLQMAEIVRMLMGEPVPVNPSDNDAKHLQTIDFFMTSDLWETTPDNAKQVILEHRAAHMQSSQVTEDLATQLGQGRQGGPSPFSGGGTNGDNPEAFNPANEGRRATANERSAVDPNFGAGGQLG